MSSVESKIQAADSKNRELLAILADTDYAPPALNQQNKYITDLENELKSLDKSIKQLETSRVKELKDHEKYRDSVMKRFAYKMTRQTEKFDAKASKEEKEYFDALHSEHKAKEARAATQQTLNEAKNHQSELQSVDARHRSAQKELDDLYDSIFEGPTPGFEQEDSREQQAHTALNNYHTTRTQVEAEEQVLKILSNAVTYMNTAVRSMDEARSHSQMDMFGGGSITDMMERSALHKAEQSCMQAQMLVLQAQRLSPHVQDIPKPNIAQSNLMSDVFFDNIFTDMNFHEKIKASQVEVQRSAKAVDHQGQNTKQRLKDLKQQLNGQSQELADARLALQKAREQAFEMVVAGRGGTGGGAGPVSSNGQYYQPPSHPPPPQQQNNYGNNVMDAPPPQYTA